MKVETKFETSPQAIAKRITGNRQTLLFMANEAKRVFNDYVPYRDGALSDTARVGAEDGKGYVEYVQPYAADNYYGAHKRFGRDVHPLATAFWDRAAMQARGDAYKEAIQAYMDRG